MSERHRTELDRHFTWFKRKPPSRYVRIPLAVLSVVRGNFSFLPVLGLRMLPLGLLLFALDVPALRKPVARMFGWVERKRAERQRIRSMQRINQATLAIPFLRFRY